MVNNFGYLIEFNSADDNLIDAGFDVCLALVTLDFPLAMITNSAAIEKKCDSLKEFGVASVFQKSALSPQEYAHLKSSTPFYLVF